MPVSEQLSNRGPTLELIPTPPRSRPTSGRCSVVSGTCATPLGPVAGSCETLMPLASHSPCRAAAVGGESMRQMNSDAASPCHVPDRNGISTLVPAPRPFSRGVPRMSNIGRLTGLASKSGTPIQPALPSLQNSMTMTLHGIGGSPAQHPVPAPPPVSQLSDFVGVNNSPLGKRQSKKVQQRPGSATINGRLGHLSRGALSGTQTLNGTGMSGLAVTARVDSALSMFGTRYETKTTSNCHAEMAGGELGDIGGKVNQYLLLAHIGSGSQGSVFLAVDGEKGGDPVAIKALSRTQVVPGVGGLRHLHRRKAEAVAAEVAALKRCRHQNIVALHEVIDDPTANHLYLVMQYVEHGPLVRMLPDGTVNTPLSPSKVMSYARQLLAGLEYLHRHSIVHRDIKPDNILLGKDDGVYLADFGVSELFEDDPSPPMEVPESECATAAKLVTALSLSTVSEVVGSTTLSDIPVRGTAAFMPPEQLADQLWSIRQNTELRGLSAESDATMMTQLSDSSAASSIANPLSRLELAKAGDVWALGLSLHVMLYGSLPFPVSHGREEYVAAVLSPMPVRIPDRGADGNEVPQIAKLLIAAMLERDPARRCSVAWARSELKSRRHTA